MAKYFRVMWQSMNLPSRYTEAQMEWSFRENLSRQQLACSRVVASWR
jgi:hypothetical protein